MSSWDLRNWQRLNRFRGFTPRQRILLDLEATYYDTQFVDLRPWYPRVQEDPETGKLRPMKRRERDPGVKLGSVADKVDKLMDRLCGQGRFPSLEGIDDTFKKELEAMQLARAVYMPLFDLVVKGSGCLSFVQLPDDRFEFVHLDSVWCEPVFVSRAGSERARQIAEDLTLQGVDYGAPAAGEYLPVPEKSEPHDLCFLRYEIVFDDELAVNEFGQSARKLRYRRRRDYLLNATVFYEDQAVSATSLAPGEWKVRDVVVHGWGVVPAVWARAKGAKDGELDGPSFISPPFRSMSEAVDYMMSQKDDSAAAMCWPKQVTINLKDRIAAAAASLGKAPNQPAGSEDVIEYQSAGNGPGTAFLLEQSGAGLAAAKQHIEDLRAQMDRVTGIPEHDPAVAAGTLSGTALRLIKEPLVSRVDSYRQSAWDLIGGIIRKYAIARGLDAKKLTGKWAQVIAVTADEMLAWATALGQARTSGLVSQETAVSMFIRLMEIQGVSSPKEELAKILADQDRELELTKEKLPPEDQKPPPEAA